MCTPAASPAAPPRPAVWVAAALGLGSLAGGQLDLPEARAAAGLGALAGLALGLALGLCGRGRAGAAWPALLCALALLQAGRASASAPGTPRDAGVYEGRLQVLRADEESLFARLTGEGSAGPVFELPAGSAREGERVRLSPGNQPPGSVRAPGSPATAAPAPLRVEVDQVERLAVGGLATRLRRALHGRCERLGSPWARGLAAALVLGERDGLDSRQVDLFARVGLRHLLAVSGMHAALFGALLLWPLAAGLQGLWSRRPAGGARDPLVARSLLVACGLLLYAPLAGGAAPVRRAALAGALACLTPLAAGRAHVRRADSLSLWGAALASELALDARAHEDVGLQLSYGAALTLILATARLDLGLRRLFAPRPRAGLARSGWRRLPGLLAGRAARAARMACAASLAASLGTLPLVAFHFGEWSPWGVLLTPLALLLVAWLLPAGWLGLALPGPLAGHLFEPAAELLLTLARWADALPGTPACLPTRPLWLTAGVAVAGLIALRPGARPAWRRAACLGASLCLWPWTGAPRGLEVVAVDVGHGTAVVLRAPGAGVWIFDGGSRDRSRVGRLGLGRVLADWEAGRPHVVLSHEDRDHLSGLAWLLERYPPRAWWGALPAPLADRIPHDAPHTDLDNASLTFEPAPALRLELLRGSAAPDNEGSRALAVTWHGARVLLCGDAEGEGLSALLASWRPPGPLDLLLLPHHGSHSPWLGALLEAWRPAEVWISASQEPPVAAELDRRGWLWRCTARDGPLEAGWRVGPGTSARKLRRDLPDLAGPRSQDAGPSRGGGGGPDLGG